METELENLQQINTSLDLQLAELREKLNATTNELTTEHQYNRTSNALLRRIRFDLHHASGLIQEPKKLKDAVRKLYHKYSQDSDFSRKEDIDAHTEFMRQREHLERTVASLKRQVFKDASGKRDDSVRVMEENSTLIVELNNVRKELKTARKQIVNMESLLGLSSKYIHPKEAQARLQMAVTTHQDIHNEYRAKLEDMEKVIMALKEEVHRLVSKLSKEEQEEYHRETSQKVTLQVRTSTPSV